MVLKGGGGVPKRLGVTPNEQEERFHLSPNILGKCYTTKVGAGTGTAGACLTSTPPGQEDSIVLVIKLEGLSFGFK